jgi:hypothetical protein
LETRSSDQLTSSTTSATSKSALLRLYSNIRMTSKMF